MATSTRFATGIHALVLLARRPDQVHSSEAIAEKLQTNPVVVRRVLAQLQHAGLIRNYKGPSGGSQLVRRAAETTVADVYRATEPAAPFRPSLPGGPGPASADAKRVNGEVRRLLASAEAAMLVSLQGTTLEQIAGRIGGKKN